MVGDCAGGPFFRILDVLKERHSYILISILLLVFCLATTPSALEPVHTFCWLRISCKLKAFPWMRGSKNPNSKGTGFCTQRLLLLPYELALWYRFDAKSIATHKSHEVYSLCAVICHSILFIWPAQSILLLSLPWKVHHFPPSLLLPTYHQHHPLCSAH